MSLYKIKNPVEYSFVQWMNNFPDSGHWADKERFFEFVKTVCSHKEGLKWKNPNYIKSKILDSKPTFDQDFLENILDLYLNLLEFQGSKAVSRQFRISDRKIKANHFIEIRVENGNILEEVLPLKSPVTFGAIVN